MRSFAATVSLLLLTSSTLERVGQQQLLNLGAEAIYRDWHYSQTVRAELPRWTAVGVTSLMLPKAKVRIAWWRCGGTRNASLGEILLPLAGNTRRKSG